MAKCNILSLSGGGYKGLFTASVLDSFEQKTNQPIGQSFDLIAGTSIGGILALAAAFEVPMSLVVEQFREHGERLFSHKRFNYGLFSAKYSQGILKEIIQRVLPEKCRLGDALHPLLIPSVNMTSGKIQMFKTPHHSSLFEDKDLFAVDVALATSAAPTYFPLAQIKGSSFADGGLFANAPDLSALHEVEHYWDISANNVHMLSIGALSAKFSIDPNLHSNMGKAQWMSKLRLIETMMSSQQQLSHQLMVHKLDKNYYRLDETLSAEQVKSIGLDVANTSVASTLIGIGTETAKRSYKELEQKGFWKHLPTNRISKG